MEYLPARRDRQTGTGKRELTNESSDYYVGDLRAHVSLAAWSYPRQVLEGVQRATPELVATGAAAKCVNAIDQSSEGSMKIATEFDVALKQIFCLPYFPPSLPGTWV